MSRYFLQIIHKFLTACILILKSGLQRLTKFFKAFANCREKHNLANLKNLWGDTVDREQFFGAESGGFLCAAGGFCGVFFADGVGFYDQGGGRAAVGAAGKPRCADFSDVGGQC